MRKIILVIGIIALFIGMASFSVATSIKNNQLEKNGPGWEYQIFGRIKSYEIKEFKGQQYVECKAIIVRSIWFNVVPGHPNAIMPMTLRNGQIFNIPYDNATIIIHPTIMGNYFIMATGVLN